MPDDNDDTELLAVLLAVESFVGNARQRGLRMTALGPEMVARGFALMLDLDVDDVRPSLSTIMREFTSHLRRK